MIKEYNNKTIKVEVNKEDLQKSNIIYKFTFPNNKVYIGQTKNRFLNRLTAHCNKSKDLKSIIHRAIQKYKTFKVEILHQADINCLDTLEKLYIAKYKSTNREFGYNLDSGGNLRKICSEETKKKMSKSRVGINTKDNHYKARKIIVININNQEKLYFNSIIEASNYFKLSKNTISNNLAGRSKSFKNKQYYAEYK